MFKPARQPFIRCLRIVSGEIGIFWSTGVYIKQELVNVHFAIEFTTHTVEVGQILGQVMRLRLR